MAGTATTAERRAAATANFFMIFSFSWCGTTPFGSRHAPLNGVRGCRFNERIIQNGTISLPVLFLQHSLSRPWELIDLYQEQKTEEITKIKPSPSCFSSANRPRPAWSGSDDETFIGSAKRLVGREGGRIRRTM